MTQVIPNGGNRDSQDLYVGQVGEITIDYSNQEIRLHDGATPGGKRIANLDELSNLFQQHSDELDGLLGFKANAKGLLVRRGAATYALRQVVSSDSSLTIDNPRGFDGDFSVRISDVVPSDHEWTGQQLFSDVIQANAGINGDLSGNVTGNLTGDSAGTHVGGIDTRDFTVQFDDNQIPKESIDGLVALLGALTTPIGMIVMWGGEIANIPNHWHLCDGTNGTPNLVDRFIYGTATEDQMLFVGGAQTHTHVSSMEPDGAHVHSGEVGDTSLDVTQIPAHLHYNGVCDNDTNNVMFSYGLVAATAAGGSNTSSAMANVNITGVSQGKTSTVGGGQTHTHSLDLDEGGEHIHAVAVEAANHLPPYVRLAYIMRIN